MKANELRIGNFLQGKDGKLAVVCEIYEEEYKAYSGMITKLPTTPIPLTEKWLIDFGFSGQPCDYAKDKLIVCLKDSDSFHTKGRTYYNSWVILEKQPKYVHQLQNLYFALTGEELKIKEL